MAQNAIYDCYYYNNDWSKVDYSEEDTYSNKKVVYIGYSKIFKYMFLGLRQKSYYISCYAKASIVKGKSSTRIVHI